MGAPAWLTVLVALVSSGGGAAVGWPPNVSTGSTAPWDSTITHREDRQCDIPSERSHMADDIITGVIAVIASVYAWWRNNNLTGAAVQGQQLTNAIKANIIATATDATTGTAQAAYAVSDSRGADATADVAPIEEVSYGDGE